MAKLIKDVHDLVNFLAGKSIATRQAPEKIDTILWDVVIDLFKENYKHYVKTQEVSDYLLPFKRTKTITVTSNIGQLPADYQHCRAIRTASGAPVKLVEDKFWDGVKNSKVAPPSATNVIARIDVPESDATLRIIEVHPTQNVVMEYFKAPVKPFYAYDVQGTRYVYNDTASIDIEFGPLLLPEIKKRVLSGLGINLRDRDLTIYAEQTKQTELPK